MIEFVIPMGPGEFVVALFVLMAAWGALVVSVTVGADAWGRVRRWWRGP